MSSELYRRAAEALPTIREAVAACYLIRLHTLNKGPWYQHEQYRIRLELTRDSIALAIQNNIEGALIGEYGAVDGVINSAELLLAMFEQTNHLDEVGGLSELGVTLMDNLFKSLVEMAHDARAKGLILSPTMNHPVH